jgi:hypothetical protein
VPQQIVSDTLVELSDTFDDWRLNASRIDLDENISFDDYVNVDEGIMACEQLTDNAGTSFEGHDSKL